MGVCLAMFLIGDIFHHHVVKSTTMPKLTHFIWEHDGKEEVFTNEGYYTSINHYEFYYHDCHEYNSTV